MRTIKNYPHMTYSKNYLTIENCFFGNIPVEIRALKKDWLQLEDYFNTQRDDFLRDFLHKFFVPSWRYTRKSYFSEARFKNAMRLQSYLLYAGFSYFYKKNPDKSKEKLNKTLPDNLSRLEIEQELKENFEIDNSPPTIYTAYCMHQKYARFFEDIYFSPFGRAIFEEPVLEKMDKLLQAVRKDNYYPFLSKNDRAANILNKLLECPNFYEKVRQKKNIKFTEKIRKLVEKTEDYRTKIFQKLQPDEQRNIITLNRALIEKIYPKITPKRTLYLQPFYENYYNFNADGFLHDYIQDGREFLNKGKDITDLLDFLLRYSEPPHRHVKEKTPYISNFVYTVNKCFEMLWTDECKKQKTNRPIISKQSLKKYLGESISSLNLDLH